VNAHGKISLAGFSYSVGAFANPHGRPRRKNAVGISPDAIMSPGYRNSDVVRFRLIMDTLVPVCGRQVADAVPVAG
jgi:hypothetical protein